MINPWIFGISESNGKRGRVSKPNILQVAIRGVSQTMARLNDVKFGGAVSLCQRKPVKHIPENKFFVPLDDGSGSRAYLAVNKKGNSQLEALNQTPPLDNLS